MIKWQEWCEKTIKTAKEQNKAIFIYIGYPTCHWCEVMQKEVFENKECKEILNKNFICIKIDKNKRPDIDKYYQEVHLLLNNHKGGWPTCVFATPQNKPFFAETYMPLETKKDNGTKRTGFLELIKVISEKIAKDDQELYENARDVEKFLAKENHPKEATVLNENFINNFMLQAKNNYDTKNGGFATAPKFPHANTLNTLMTIDELYGDNLAKKMVLHTLDSMSKNNFFDKKEGAFYRYSNDESFCNPSEDKTIYDNALLCRVYIKAYKLYTDKQYLKIAKRCANFLSKQKAQHPYDAMIADSFFELGVFDKTYIQKAQKILQNEQKPKFLDDYAFFIRALISSYYLTDCKSDITKALKLTNEAIARFYKNGVWYFNDNEFKTKAKATDTPYTSAISIMIDNLLSVSEATKDKKYKHFAFKTLQYNSYELARKPIYFPYMLTQMLRYLQKH